MKKDKYEFEEVYYSNLDNQIEEITKFKKYLSQNIDLNKYFISYISCQHDNEKIIDVQCNNNDDINKYIFIESQLAGLGINNFIVISDSPNVCDVIKTCLVNMSLYDYYGDDWIELLLSKGIQKIYKTDCDGAVGYLYEKQLILREGET